MTLTSVEMCAGAGGQALGLEGAGFSHEALIEIEPHACGTLLLNRPEWRVCQGDLSLFDGSRYRGVDLLAGGLPCPPFSIAGKQLGNRDERNLFPEAIRLTDEIQPKAVMIENVRGLLGPVFAEYRQHVTGKFEKLGYVTDWKLLNASDYGVPQLRPRVVLVAIQRPYADEFIWPDDTQKNSLRTVGETLFDLMSSRGWLGAKSWRQKANRIAPTIVGGSKKHGGPDLGPTRARKAWAELGVNGLSLANEAPEPEFIGMPRLTVRMVARLQGFPDSWKFAGRKTSAYRQVGNAFPPPVAQAVAANIYQCLAMRRMVAVA